MSTRFQESSKKTSSGGPTGESVRCGVSLEELYDFIDDVLPPNKVETIGKHIASCLACARSLARIELEYQEQILAYVQGEPVPLPPSSRFVEDTYAKIRARIATEEGEEETVDRDSLTALLESHREELHGSAGARKAGMLGVILQSIRDQGAVSTEERPSLDRIAAAKQGHEKTGR